MSIELTCILFCCMILIKYLIILIFRDTEKCFLPSSPYNADKFVDLLCSTDKLYADLGWDTLQERRNKHKLVILYKIINGLTPQYLHDVMPPLIQEATNYILRNSNNMRNLWVNTNLFYNSFFLSSIQAWNDLSDEIKSSPSVSSFKYRLKRNDRFRRNTSMLALGWVKYYMHDWEWSVAPWILISIEKT